MKWISVEDRLPDIEYVNGEIGASKTFLAFDGKDQFTASRTKGNSFDLITPIDCGCCNKYKKITHWMPLPEPPDCKENQ